MKIYIIKLYLMLLMIFYAFTLIEYSICEESEVITLKNEHEQIRSVLIFKYSV